MRLPRRGILIRIVIYGALISFFGWQAWKKSQEDAELSGGADDPADGPRTREATLPDGRRIEYIELTPEEAQKRFGASPAFERDDKPAAPPADAPPAPATPATPEEGTPAAPAAPE
jgi:hypothetical protein